MLSHSFQASLLLSLVATASYGFPVEQVFTVLPHAKHVSLSYDYIIVGGGTAGLTVADRLTEDSNTTVLVVEHGDLVNSTLISNVTGGTNGINPMFLYPITSLPQANLLNRTFDVFTGKLVGGSSAVNAMIAMRGTAEDYDRWGTLFNDSSSTGWTWSGMLPYFRKALNFVPPLPEIASKANITYDTRFWGNTSRVYASWPSYQFPGYKPQEDAFREMSEIEFPPDSGAGRPGVYWFPQFMDPHEVTRSYARTGHYNGVPKERSNYHLIAGSKVLTVLLNGTTAVGVKFVSAANGSEATMVLSNKEVILSAGAIHSPQILQRSGIGPKKLLQEANISVSLDLPGVGQNFQDHFTYGNGQDTQLLFNFTKFNISPIPSDLTTNATFQKWAKNLFDTNKTGPFSFATGNIAAKLPFRPFSDKWSSLADTLAAQDPADYLPANSHATVIAGYKAQLLALSGALRSNDTAWISIDLTGAPLSGFLGGLKPLSRGRVTINTTDPFGAEPLVDYRALTNPMDTAVLLEMIRFCRKYYLENDSNAKYGPVEVTPGVAVQSDADLAPWLAKSLLPTEYHPTGTCSMMPLALGGVVDQNLRVYGVKRLRVVDASIMPIIPGANTCQPVYALAEKAADIIKKDMKESKRGLKV